jgi:tetratricopeptide (TPR) repeat protein
LTSAIEVSKSDNYSRGVALYDQGLYTESIAEFERVLEAVPEDRPERKFASFYMCEAYANLGLTHLRMNMYRRAEEELNLALMIHPNYPDIHFCLAVTFYKQARYQRAETHLKRALEINPRYARARMYLGMTRLRRGDIEGLGDISESTCIEPAYQGVQYGRAMSLYQSGDLDRCLHLLEEVAETDADQVSTALEAGLRLMNMGQSEEATKAFLEAVAVCPNYADLRHYLGLCYLEQGMLEMAIGQLRHAIEINPDFVEAQTTLAIAVEMAGQTSG